VLKQKPRVSFPIGLDHHHRLLWVLVPDQCGDSPLSLLKKGYQEALLKGMTNDPFDFLDRRVSAMKVQARRFHLTCLHMVSLMSALAVLAVDSLGISPIVPGKICPLDISPYLWDLVVGHNDCIDSHPDDFSHTASILARLCLVGLCG